MNTSTVTGSLDWNEITNKHGAETRLAIERLLADYNVPPDGSIAVLIAGMFISQKDSITDFAKLSEILEEGQSDLSAEFKRLIEQLRGIISFAQEHLVETSAELDQKRQEKTLNYVKQGVAKAISNANGRQERRSIFTILFIMGAASAIALLGIGFGSVITMSAIRQSVTRQRADVDSIIEGVPNAETWEGVIELNAETMQNCIDQAAELEKRCVVNLP